MRKQVYADSVQTPASAEPPAELHSNSHMLNTLLLHTYTACLHLYTHTQHIQYVSHTCTAHIHFTHIKHTIHLYLHIYCTKHTFLHTDATHFLHTYTNTQYIHIHRKYMRKSTLDMHIPCKLHRQTYIHIFTATKSTPTQIHNIHTCKHLQEPTCTQINTQDKTKHILSYHLSR